MQKLGICIVAALLAVPAFTQQPEPPAQPAAQPAQPSAQPEPPAQPAAQPVQPPAQPEPPAQPAAQPVQPPAQPEPPAQPAAQPAQPPAQPEPPAQPPAQPEAPAQPAQAMSLDGTQWKMCPQSVWKRIAATLRFSRARKLTFEGGMVSMSKGKPVAYSAVLENGKTAWKAEKSTRKGVKISWAATVTGDEMTGSVTRTDAEGKTNTRSWKACKIAAGTAR